ncbi:MAG: pyridoxamine 5'-phosphate oxidase family protein [Cyclobacteriaceae bacterium]|nr:pyridoxamine 5'-phosphate oxidase family protein [Cyclobacteriaceae bacterium]
MLGHLDTEEIETLLRTSVVGRIGCTFESKVYVVPVTYVYEDGYVIGHTIHGLKIDILRKNPECCFEVDEMSNISNWKSVIAWGTFEELSGAEAERASEKLHAKLAPLIPSETSYVSRMGPISDTRTATQTNNPIVYRINLREKTGRYEKQ